MHPRLLTLPAFELFGRTLGPFTLHTYGFLLAIAFLAGLCGGLAPGAPRRARRGARHRHGGLRAHRRARSGAKLLLVVVDWRYYVRSPARALSIFQSGGVFYGGLLGGAPGGLVVRPQRTTLPGWRDRRRAGARAWSSARPSAAWAASPPAAATARPTTVPWAVTFRDVYAARARWARRWTPRCTPPSSTSRWPAFLIFFVLLWLAPRKTLPRPGRARLRRAATP